MSHEKNMMKMWYLKKKKIVLTIIDYLTIIPRGRTIPNV